MSPIVVKGIGFTGGAALLSLGTWRIYSFVTGSEIYWKPLVAEANETFAEDTIGKTFGHFLVGMYGEEDKNKEWWEKSYRVWKIDSEGDESEKLLSDEFKDSEKIKSAFSKKAETGTDNDKALNKVCKTIYDKKTTEITSTTEDNKSKLNKNLWKYCSPLRTKPKTVKEEGKEYGANTWGEQNKDKLVAVGDSSNDKFWKLRNIEFFGKDKDTPGIGANLTSTDSFFKALYDDKEKADRGTIENKCKEAYSLKTGENDANKKITSQNLLKFCSLEGK